jgi:uncharacterized protein YqgC (DUF456 family)
VVKNVNFHKWAWSQRIEGLRLLAGGSKSAEMDQLIGFWLGSFLLFFAVVWIVFPFLVVGKLKEQQKTLDQIERNTRQATEK